jgi:LruC domain-containing protein
MKSRIILLSLLSLSITFISCRKTLPILETNTAIITDVDMTNLKASDLFTWETSSTVTFTIKTLDDQGLASPNIKISVFTDYKDSNGKEIFSGLTNDQGVFKIDHNIASTVDSLVISSNYNGYANEAKVAIENKQVDYIFDGISEPANNTKSSVAFKEDPIDTDGDGVIDTEDAYPEDASMAFNNYYPNATDHGTLAFEDLWPSQADYDFNDLVIDYNFNSITNTNNEVVKLEVEFNVKNVGGSHRNGFAFEMENILSEQVSSVTGSSILLTSTNYITTTPTGVEAGQTNATIIVFDNAWYHFADGDQYDTIVTDPETELNIAVTFNQPIPLDQFGLAPFNPFIMVNKTRGREIHLPNYAPTDLADTAYFSTFDDDSSLEFSKYYKSVDNLPWAINIPTSFSIPVEKEAINNGYLKFIPWVESGGSLFNDWYLNLSEYRDSNFLY